MGNQQIQNRNRSALMRGETRSGHSTSVSSRLLEKYQGGVKIKPKVQSRFFFRGKYSQGFWLPCRLACHHFATVIQANPMAKIRRVFCNPVVGYWGAMERKTGVR